MTQTTKPTKQRVRDYMDQRTYEEDPPPTPDEIRMELGWFLIPSNGQGREVED